MITKMFITHVNCFPPALLAISWFVVICLRSSVCEASSQMSCCETKLLLLLLNNTGRNSPLRTRVCQSTVCLTSFVRRQKSTFILPVKEWLAVSTSTVQTFLTFWTEIAPTDQYLLKFFSMLRLAPIPNLLAPWYKKPRKVLADF